MCQFFMFRSGVLKNMICLCSHNACVQSVLLSCGFACVPDSLVCLVSNLRFLKCALLLSNCVLVLLLSVVLQIWRVIACLCCLFSNVPLVQNIWQKSHPSKKCLSNAVLSNCWWLHRGHGICLFFSKFTCGQVWCARDYVSMLFVVVFVSIR